jgi:alpha-D-ribose 1-methylphosphonate 5-phosphate C-P lyase
MFYNVTGYDEDRKPIEIQLEHDDFCSTCGPCKQLHQDTMYDEDGSELFTERNCMRSHICKNALKKCVKL